MNNLVAFPVLLPLLSALALLAVRQNSRARRAANLLSLSAQVLVALLLAAEAFTQGPQTLLLGAWKAPFGIAMAVDKTSAIFLVLSTSASFFAVLWGYLEKSVAQSHPLRAPLIQFLAAGTALAFLTGDLFTLFVAFEVLLIASYALMTLEADPPAVRHAFPYLAINLFGSILFVSACGLAYSLFGSLNFADISVRAMEMGPDPRITVLAVMLVLVFGIKAGMFPLFYWLPDSYPMMPTTLVALYSGLLTKVGVYVLFRLLVTVLPGSQSGVYDLLLWLSLPTMVLGVIGALAKDNIRAILSFHIVSQIGYMLLALGLFNAGATAAALLFIIHQVPVKSSLFLIGGTARALNGSDRLDKMGNLWVHAPWLGAIWLVQAFSLAGLPPLSGFWGKALIVLEGFRAEHPVMAGIALAVSLLTMLSMLKIFMAAFWHHDPAVPVNLRYPGWRKMQAVTAIIAVLCLGIGFGANTFLGLARSAADELHDGRAYRSAVLSVGGLKGGEAKP
jgi:multicomponent Na+:H+ antiporter subunit D